MGRLKALTPRKFAGPLPNGREIAIVRQIFETWWIELPDGFDETWVADGGYWHAWDGHRSISVSSTVLTDRVTDVAAPADEIVEMLAGCLEGEPIDDLPPGLPGRAAIIETDPRSRASRAVTGFIAVDGRLLTATITSDDIDWAKRIWRSIGYRPAPLPPRLNRAARRARARARVA
jgi:hypothetical protein